MRTRIFWNYSNALKQLKYYRNAALHTYRNEMEASELQISCKYKLRTVLHANPLSVFGCNVRRSFVTSFMLVINYGEEDTAGGAFTYYEMELPLRADGRRRGFWSRKLNRVM